MPSRNKNNFQNTMIGTLAIGILGSALWEKVIAPLSEFIFVKSSTLLSFFGNNVIDAIYRSVPNDTNSFLLLMIFVYSIFSLMILLTYTTKILYQIDKLLLHLRQNQASSKHVSDLSTFFPYRTINQFYKSSLIRTIISVFVCLLFGVILGYITGRTVFIANLHQNTLANIEIVSPYVEDREYKQLKSDFYSISCEDDYEKLSNKLNSIAVENDLSLRE